MALVTVLTAGPTVALLAEGVGRNKKFAYGMTSRLAVALLAEGVGRNIDAVSVKERIAAVALLAEGVGRNLDEVDKYPGATSRPPRGGCG